MDHLSKCFLITHLVAIVALGIPNAVSASDKHSTVSEKTKSDARVSFERSLKNRKPGAYKNSGYIYFVQKLETNGDRQEKVSRRLSIEAGRHALELARQRKPSAFPSTVQRGKLGELIWKAEQIRRWSLSLRITGTGKQVYRDIGDTLAISVLRFEEKELLNNIDKIKPSDWSAIRKKVWLDAIKRKDFPTLRDISLETANFDDYFAYTFMAESHVYLANGFPAINEDPIVFSQLVIRKFVDGGPVRGLSSGPGFAADDKLGIISLPRLFLKFLYANSDTISRAIGKISDSTNNSEEKEYLKSILAVSTASRSADLYAETKSLKAVAVYYAFKNSGFLPFSLEHKNSESRYFKDAKALFLQGDPLKLPTIKRLLLKSIGMAPRHQASWAHLGASYLAMNNLPIALGALRAALILKIEDLGVRRNLAYVYEKLGYNAQAVRTWQAITDRSLLAKGSDEKSAVLEAEQRLLILKESQSAEEAKQ